MERVAQLVRYERWRLSILAEEPAVGGAIFDVHEREVGRQTDGFDVRKRGWGLIRVAQLDARKGVHPLLQVGIAPEREIAPIRRVERRKLSEDGVVGIDAACRDSKGVPLAADVNGKTVAYLGGLAHHDVVERAVENTSDRVLRIDPYLRGAVHV